MIVLAFARSAVRARRLVVVALFVLAAALSAAAMPAVANEVETVATGSGGDENEALADALARAVSQVNGVSSSLDVSTRKGVVTADSSGRKGDVTEDSRVRVEAGVTPDARMRAAGRVTRYDVLETTSAEGKVTVRVRAYVSRPVAAKYDAPGSAAGKRRIAVLPGSATRAGYDFFGDISGAELADLFAGTLERTAMKTGMVSALDRATLAASLLELGLVGSDLTGPAEKAKLRQFRGADLVVMSSVSDAEFVDTSSVVQSTGQVRRSFSMIFQVDVRAVVPATGELLVSERYVIRDARSREDAVLMAAESAAIDVIRTLTGKTPQLDPGRYAVDEAPLMPEPSGPRRSGVTLPVDRKRQ